MPANLTPVYREAEARYRTAVTREEKIVALEEMLRVIPKHKGTEKLQADLRSRIAKLKKEPQRKAGARAFSHRVPRRSTSCSRPEGGGGREEEPMELFKHNGAKSAQVLSGHW